VAYGNPFTDLYQFRNGKIAPYSWAIGWYDAVGQLVPVPAVASGMVFSRKLYSPAGGGYLRYLEMIDNPTGAVVTVAPEVFGTLAVSASGTWSYAADPATVGGYAIVQADGMPKVGMVMQGSGTVSASVQTVSATALAPDWAWNLDIAAGGRACILHFIFQAGPQDTTLDARAQALRNLDGAALNALGFDSDPLFGLTANERACIKNFNVPPAP
jgi:hypothetical protein